MMEQFIMNQLLVLNNTYILYLRHLGNAANTWGLEKQACYCLLRCACYCLLRCGIFWYLGIQTVSSQATAETGRPLADH